MLGTLALAGLAGVLSLTTPYWLIAALMFAAGIGNGLFNSPNSSLIMGSVAPDRRGVAAGIRSLLMSVGGVVAIIFTLSIVVSEVPRDVMLQVFSGLSSNLPAATLTPFVDGLKLAFWILAGISALSAVLAFLLPPAQRTSGAPQAAD